jgi:hypothetical protein
VAIVFSGGATFVIASVLKRVWGLRATEQEERDGQDLHVHGERGVPFRSDGLQADAGVRAGIIGRHRHADLSLGAEGSLSLRHCVVVVTLEGQRTLRTWVSDLDSEAGLRSEDRAAVSSVESDGPFLLQAPGGALVFVPSGWGVPWQPDAADPFETLPRRCSFTGAFDPRAALPATSVMVGSTKVHFHEGPTSKRAPRQTLLDGELELGQVEVSAAGRQAVVPVGLAALERGLLFGRYDRCVGAGLFDGSISRVHALLVARARQLVMVDTGSTNGLFCGGRLVRCEQVVPQAWYELAAGARVRWLPRAAGNG